jgi:hypothetical protein
LEVGLHLIRVLAGYFAALLFAAAALNAWTQATTAFYEAYVGVMNPTGGFVARLQWFISATIVVFAVTFPPTAVCVVIAERRGSITRRECAMAGMLMGAWPLVFLFFLLPFYVVSPLIGYLAGTIYWLIAGRHAGSWRVTSSPER